MRNYAYQSRIITELYLDDAMSRCEIVTLHYDGSTESHQMWMTKRQFEAALDGDQDTRRAIEAAYTDLVKSGRI
jgi:hypothetical protein